MSDRTPEDPTLRTASLDAIAANALFTLDVPALGPADYVRLQALLVGPAMRPSWRRIAGLLGGAVVGGLVGGLASAWDLRAEFWLTSARKDWELSLGGAGLLLAALGLVAATVLVLGVILSSRQRRGAQALLAAAGDLLGAHELLLGPEGLLWRNPSRVLFVPWSRVTGATRRNGMLFIVADRISAFWLPEALIATRPDRQALEEFLRRHGALP